MKRSKIASGQSLVEFALTLPLMFLLVMGLFDIGRAIFYFAILNNAAREGTRYAVVQIDCDYKSDPNECNGYYLDSYPLDCQNAGSTANINICTEISEKFLNLADLSTSSITIDHILSGTGDPVISIDIHYVFQPITPGLALLGELPLHVNSQMMMTPVAKP